jgi:hypothetical protein
MGFGWSRMSQVNWKSESMPGTPTLKRYCPKCGSIMGLSRVAASPSVDYEAHTFGCPNCRLRYTARIDTPLGMRTLRLKGCSSIGMPRVNSCGPRSRNGGAS